MKCIYSIFYKNLKNYDGRDVDRDRRMRVYEYCRESYERFTDNGIECKFEYSDDMMSNTVEMYYDKMMRIREYNRTYDVLWVDGDTLCLDYLHALFRTDRMKGVFWGWWDGFNMINGGVIYYPRGYLHNNWDKFSYDWIRLLGKLSDNGEKFIGPFEQIPITNLMIRQSLGECGDYSLFKSYEKLRQGGYLLDYGYNCNPLFIHNMDSRCIYASETHDICNKRILHFNFSEADYDVDLLCEYIHNNLIGYTSNGELLRRRCDELGISNCNFKIDIDRINKIIKVTNDTLGFLKLFIFDVDNFDVKHSYRCVIYPGHFIERSVQGACYIIIKNILSGEQQLIKL